ncbi:DNA topoisomerase 1 [Gammaproteobacteria bacterium]
MFVLYRLFSFLSKKPMDKKLVIVESPAKARTIKKYLGPGFEVMASYGHVRDLLPKSGAVDTENGFLMKYEIIERNKKHLDAITKAAQESVAIYLATDPDREGEAISWHIHEILLQRHLLKNKDVWRVAFHEITKRAVNEAMDNPRELSRDLVNSQQARRALDYLVGFNLSPLLWKKIRGRLSAGRVQSPALRLIVERENEIELFEQREYWTIEADWVSAPNTFIAKLSLYQEEKISQFSITRDEEAHVIRDALIARAAGKLRVVRVEKKSRKRNPAPPFITSTLQQEAARKLGFSASRAMIVAQQLYEGIDVGSGAVGLITYMRTDSTSLAAEAITDLRVLISSRYGEDKLPEQPPVYRTTAKNAQEAHEAIRPTDAHRLPEQLQGILKPEQWKLYDLIWKRTVACQMIPAVINTVAVDFSPGMATGEEDIFRATGSSIAKPGYMAVYQEGVDDIAEEKESLLPPLKVGKQVELREIRAEQHFTEPPPRYNEATLVKSLEELGIGRPSTYASILATLQQREYAVLENKRFQPTDVGKIVNRFLTEHFNRYVDYGFTATLEDELDAVSRGEKDWIPVMEAFWKPFHALVKLKEKSVDRKDVTHEAMDENCPQCGKPLSIRLGRRGRFVGCTGYPECDYARNLGENSEKTIEPIVLEGRSCPECAAPLNIKQGRYGRFIGCSQYPKCKFIEPIEKPRDMQISCPKCHNGTLLQRKSRFGKFFFSCSGYPGCDYAVWNEPLAEPCPKCSWPLLTLKTTKRRGTEKVCPCKECGYTVSTVTAA